MRIGSDIRPTIWSIIENAQFIDKESFFDILWKDVIVGDICELNDREEAPADMIILSSSESSGLCYVETSNLDGESNLKAQQALPKAAKIEFNRNMQVMDGYVEHEQPNSLLYEFTGTLCASEKVSVSVKNLILRGMVLRNTDRAYGLVIFTGNDTKLSRNSQAAPSKRSNLEKNVNTALVFIFICLFMLCLISTLAHAKWHEKQRHKAWYLDSVVDESNLEAASAFVTFLILFNNLTPISLYISMEVVRLYQARLIEADVQMYHKETDTAALARTSNLNEELGQVEYIFSDKTGTLTCNEMELRKCSIGGRSYYVGDPTRGFNTTISMLSLHNTMSDDFSQIDALEDSSLLEALSASTKELHEFMMCLAICHTAIPEKRNHEGPSNQGISQRVPLSIVYQSQSPDEIALVSAANELGYSVIGLEQDILVVKCRNSVERIQILNVNEFNSIRKRMSVVCKRQDGRIQIYCKGADSVMLQRVLHSSTFYRETVSHINRYAVEGLRTLVLAKATLSPHVYHEWKQRFDTASNAMMYRDILLAEAADAIEVNLQLLGATAIEDKLQEGVPNTINTLTTAGIKIWVLTGDKQETAINISYSTKLFEQNMSILVLNYSSEEDVLPGLNQARLEAEMAISSNQQKVGVVVDGRSLEYIMSDEERRFAFLEVAKLGTAVVACRVSPSQKADMVRMVKHLVKPQPVTLAIGDGANDVSMIQEAHVGVGVSGKEGMQAVQSSDYAIAQFRFLARLVLVHGRWDYSRICKLILYSFYKNMTFVFTLFYFVFNNGFSGTTLYDSWLGAGWNVGWTLLPIIFVSILDQDASISSEKYFPVLYYYGQAQMGFSLWTFFQWSANAFVHSLLIYFLGTTIFQGIIDENGHSSGLFTMGTAINCVLMLTVNAKVSLETHYWTKLNIMVVLGSVLMWFIFVISYSYMPRFGADFISVGVHLLSRKLFWISLPLVPLTCVVYDVSCKMFRHMYLPNPLDIVKEISAGLVGGNAISSSQIHPIAPETSFVPSSVAHAPRPAFHAIWQMLGSGHDNDTELQPLGTSTRHRKSLRTQMHPRTLEFLNDEMLESQFRDYYYMVSSTQTRASMVLIFICGVLYTTVFSKEDNETTKKTSTVAISVGAIAGCYVIFCLTPYLKRVYQPSIFLASFLGSMIKTISITESGIISSTNFSIIAFIVLRLRFKYAFAVALFDLLFYFIYIATYIQLEAAKLLVYGIVLACIFSLGAFGAYKNEIAIRQDFLLQRQLKTERQQVKGILENMLPSHIAQRLECGEKNIADTEEEVSILFCDIQDFNKLVFDLNPSEFVGLLDSIYSRFDKLSARRNVRKMETVGPTYMACAGLKGSSRIHALAVCQLAFDMLDEIMNFQTSRGDQIKIRIGINTGKVISGLVGEKKPQYCLFGDTVNTASRMQSTGIVSSVQVSKTTFERLQGQFEGQPRTVDVKGKGKMETFILVKHKQISSLSWPTQNQLGGGSSVRDQRSESNTSRDQRGLYRGSQIISKVKERREHVPMNLLTLRFKDNVDLEHEYQLESRRIMAQQNKSCLTIFLIGFLGSTLFEPLTGGNTQDTIAGVVIRLCFMFIVFATLLAIKSDRFLNQSQQISCVIYFLEGLVVCLVSVAKNEKLGEMTTLSVIISLYVVFNIGGLSFILALMVCSGICLSFSVVGLAMDAVAEKSDDSDNSFGFYVLFTLLALVVDASSTRTKELYMRRNFALLSSIKAETKKSDELLHNMLPAQVIQQLKSGRSTIADVHENVAILFSDIVGFTDKASRSEPAKIIELLSRMFGIFDKLTEKHGVYKVQTIGDAYVVVAGLPSTAMHPDPVVAKRSPAERLIRFAIDMQESLTDIQTSDGESVRIRIGMHYGKLLAGVIGRTIFRYDIWGGDVLIAASMESRSEPGKIHVTEAFKRQVAHLYGFENRGETKFANDMRCNTYFLLRPTSA
eukprot:TRINITY_DN3113_c0_g1_i4.p1 TRINITY_DN3113_c0_g1~~TRINITY_DN3113_c0_g1_i4.p1  ORF type:complete len:1942 (-),score=331.27 TRINITY_DN3113_c0_g1_i4:158-5983(-)